MEYIVPLGSNCTISQYLRRLDKRVVAFPFDWNVIPIQSTIRLIENNFDDFLNKRNLKFLPQHAHRLCDDYGNEIIETPDIITPCICTKYSILFPHDFSKKGEDDLSKIINKYNKRIGRLLNFLSDNNNNFVFLAYDGKLHAWQSEQYKMANAKFKNNYIDWKNKLRHTLQIRYPNLSYEMYDLSEYKRLQK